MFIFCHLHMTVRKMQLSKTFVSRLYISKGDLRNDLKTDVTGHYYDIAFRVIVAYRKAKVGR